MVSLSLLASDSNRSTFFIITDSSLYGPKRFLKADIDSFFSLIILFFSKMSSFIKCIIF